MVTLAHVTHYVLFCCTVYAWTYALPNISQVIIVTYLSRLLIGDANMGSRGRLSLIKNKECSNLKFVVELFMIKQLRNGAKIEGFLLFIFITHLTALCAIFFK